MRLRKQEGGKGTPAPTVVDVLAHQCKIYDAESFVERIYRSGANKVSKLPFLGIIAAPEFDADAWKLVKSEGLLSVNLRQCFGEAALDAMIEVQHILVNVVGDPEKATPVDHSRLAELLGQLKSNPYVVELKSIGFEAVTALLMRNQGFENVEIRRQVPLPRLGGSVVTRDVDVCGDRNGHTECFAVECKAESGDKELDPSFVNKFYKETLKAYLADRKSFGPPTSCRAEIWTTGKVGKDAIATLKQIKLKSFTSARLLDRTAVEKELTAGTKACKALLAAIAVA